MAAGTMYSSTSIDNHSRDIRLVEILHNSSAQQSDTIECKLHRYSLDDCPQYTALSYTWGPANNSKEIRCNGLPLLIRDNLWKYLDEMRKQKDKRLFWIDAMSINQSNGVERTHQIRLMKDIYSKASSVTIWLGQSADDSDIGMDCISRSINRRRRLFFSRIWSRRQGKAVLALCERPYWRRLWILQEIALARDVEVACGSKRLGWRCVDAMNQRLKEVVAEGRIEHHPFAAAVLDSYASGLIQRLEAWREAKANSTDTLKFLLELSQANECTDVRDKVYGLLGLVRSTFADGKPLVSPDDAKSPSEVYADVLRAVFSSQEFSSVEERIKFIELLQTSLQVNPSDSYIEYETTNALLTCDTKSSARSRPCSPLGMIALLASGTNNPQLLLDEKTLQELASRFDSLMASIQERWQTLNGESQRLRPHTVEEMGQLPDIDSEIARWQTVLCQIDELQRELDKVRKIGTIVKEYRARVEDLDRRLEL